MRFLPVPQELPLPPVPQKLTEQRALLSGRISKGSTRDYNITSFAQMTHPRKRRGVAFFGLEDYPASERPDHPQGRLLFQLLQDAAGALRGLRWEEKMKVLGDQNPADQREVQRLGIGVICET